MARLSVAVPLRPRQEPLSEETSYSIILENREIRIQRKRVPIGELHLDPNNQRIQFVLALLGRTEVDESLIEETLWKYDFLRDLYHSIEQNGGLIHPIAATPDGKVLEGNCRTVSLRKLCEKYPGDPRFALVPAEVFPGDLTADQLTLLLGEWHIAGKHEWDPYEKAEYIYKAARLLNKTFDYLAYHLRMSRATIEQNIRAYELAKEFLARYPAPESLQKFSYFLESAKKKPLRERLQRDSDFKERFFTWLVDGTLDRGSQVRELAVIVDRPELERKLDKKGFWAARSALLEVEPSRASDLYKAIDHAIAKLRHAAASEVQELRKGSAAKISKLRELYRTLKEVADLSGVRLN